MKSIFLFSLILFITTSCFKKNHEVESIVVFGKYSNKTNKIKLCLKETLGYSSYNVKFHVKLNDGSVIDAHGSMHSQNNQDEKCFDFPVNLFCGRNTTNEERDTYYNIKEGNVKELTVFITTYDGNDEISSQKFTNL